MNKEQIIEAIESMTVLELSELVKALEEKFGVSAAAPVAVAAAPAAGGAGPLRLGAVQRRGRGRADSGLQRGRLPRRPPAAGGYLLSGQPLPLRAPGAGAAVRGGARPRAQAHHGQRDQPLTRPRELDRVEPPPLQVY